MAFIRGSAEHDIIHAPEQFFTVLWRLSMKTLARVLALSLLLYCTGPFLVASTQAEQQAKIPVGGPWAAERLPVYDHIVIVVEENKDYEQIIGNRDAPYINGTLKAQGANLTQMYAEEHLSEGNYFWLFSGSNHDIGFDDEIPPDLIEESNLGEQLIQAGQSFKSYSEDLPAIGSSASKSGLYRRKHAPWVSFSNIPSGTTAAKSSNLRFKDFPADYSSLPTVSFVVPNLINDMHDGSTSSAITAGDRWLEEHIDGYIKWAKQHNSLFILTFDENSDGEKGLTDPRAEEREKRNRIVTILVGAHIEPGDYPEGKGVTHVNLLRTLEAMYKLNKSGAQQRYALEAGITDDFIITNIFNIKP
jgi:phosphatidylinositol-3-phosphatase